MSSATPPAERRASPSGALACAEAWPRPSVLVNTLSMKTAISAPDADLTRIANEVLAQATHPQAEDLFITESDRLLWEIEW